MGLGPGLGVLAVAVLLAGCGPEWTPLPDIEAPSGATVLLTLDQDDLQAGANGVAEATFPLAAPRLPTRGVTITCVVAPDASALEIAEAMVHFDYFQDGKRDLNGSAGCSTAESGSGTISRTAPDAAALAALQTGTWGLRVRAEGPIRFELIVFEAEALD